MRPLAAAQAERINAVFPMRFRDDTDLAIATSFFQELRELGGSSFARAPECSWSPIPPPELRGEYVHRLTTNGGFVSFGTL
jgi:actin related protein 2/3 complex subunit 2